jgi:hypothetical protein
LNDSAPPEFRGKHIVRSRQFYFPLQRITCRFLQRVPRLLWPDDERIRRGGKNGRAADLQRELEELFTAQNTSAEGTSIPATFLRVDREPLTLPLKRT